MGSPSARDAFDTLIGLRAFDGLDTRQILEIGEEQLAAQHRARAEAGRELDPDLDEAAALDRVKDDGPADFEAALVAYRASAERTRAFVEERGLATIPDDEVLEIITDARVPARRHALRGLHRAGRR